MDQPEDPKPTMEQVLEGLRMVSLAFHLLDAQIDIVKEVLVELHPELKDQLAVRIGRAQAARVNQYVTLQEILAFLRSKTSGQIQ